MIELSPKQQTFLQRLAQTNPGLAEGLRPRAPGPPDVAMCTHEAAHAAALHAFGRRIDHAAANDTQGHVKPEGGTTSLSDLLQHLIMVLAGDMSTPEQPPLSRQAWADILAGKAADYVQSDERTVGLFARHLAGDGSTIVDQLAVIETAWNAAVDMFAERGFWPAVLAIASVLRVEHRLDGARIHELAEQHIAFGSLKSKEPYQWKN